MTSRTSPPVGIPAVLADGDIDRQLRLALRKATSQPLDAVVTVPDAPGVYLLGYHGAHRWYRGAGPYLYIGSAAVPRRRLTEHRASITQAVDFDPADFTVRWLDAGRRGAALHAEERLIDCFRPLWNRVEFNGFGSKPQGRLRAAGQSPTAWDILHPGRRWVTARPGPQDRARLIAALETAIRTDAAA